MVLITIEMERSEKDCLSINQLKMMKKQRTRKRQTWKKTGHLGVQQNTQNESSELDTKKVRVEYKHVDVSRAEERTSQISQQSQHTIHEGNESEEVCHMTCDGTVLPRGTNNCRSSLLKKKKQKRMNEHKKRELSKSLRTIPNNRMESHSNPDSQSGHCSESCMEEGNFNVEVSEQSSVFACTKHKHCDCDSSSSDGSHNPVLHTSSYIHSSDILPPMTIPGLEQYLAMDCEFVGVGPRKLSALGRCSIVDFEGCMVLDIFVQPQEPITDYRTPWSGIRRKHMKNAIPLWNAQRIVRRIVEGKILVGHAIFNDFKVMKYFHPKHLVRDTSFFKPLRVKAGFGERGCVSLKRLTSNLLGYNIQSGTHCSLEDARATMSLFKLVRLEWEQFLLDQQTSGPSTSRQQASCHLPQTPLRHRTSSMRSDSGENYLQDSFWPDDFDD